MLKILKDHHSANKATDVKKIKKSLLQQIEWLSATDKEIVEA